jgi:DNA-directed RNA polymerase subunit beta
MRYDFSKRNELLPLANLTGVQTKSYQWLLKEGLDEVLGEVGTIEDYSGRGWVLQFYNPTFDKPNITIDNAFFTGRTYDAPWYLKATIKDSIEKKEKTQNIYMGDIPVMTDRGTFIINGVERVVVSQLTRSEGVLFTSETSPITGATLGGAKVLPKNGVWLEIETSRTGIISVKIDRRRKLAITSLLRVFGLVSNESIKKAFEGVDTNPETNYIDATLARDPSANYDEACLEIYKKMRPGEPLVLENAKALVHSMFFNPRRYSLGKVGRFKVNQKLELAMPNDNKHWLMFQEDLVKIVSRVIEINNGSAVADDIDHLGNRRVKSMGELLQNQIRIGFLQLERNVKERMSLHPREVLPEPSALISTRIIASKVHSFFATGQLSQQHDQQNPLTSLDHTRRLSLMGPGGLTKERASMAVRDVHYTHYGKICPVRSPEGPNIGLITYMTQYAVVNEYGFLETPYRKIVVTNGKAKVTDTVVYLAAYDEDKVFIADASAKLDAKGYILDERISMRKGSDFVIRGAENAEYMDLIPRQIVGTSAGLIPFLSNDDVNRSLVATQQMSQAVPLVKPEAPIVGTGTEEAVALNTGYVVVAEGDGEVVFADAAKVVVQYKDKKAKTEYKLAKFIKSNQDTCINQVVRVVTGQKVKKGVVLAEGPGIVNKEVAIGTNIKAAYMIWRGYEYEDGIVISDRLVKDDILTSIHISDYTVLVLETKLGPEEITKDIPNVSEDALRNLGEDGIVAIGSKVRSGDVLVGKVAPKGETDLSAEERLLRAIFGEKAKEIRDNSLTMPHGERGVVIGVKRVTREDNKELQSGVIEEVTVYVAQQRKIEVGDKLAGRHGNKGVISVIAPEIDMPHMEDGTTVDIIFASDTVLKRMNVGQILEAPLGFAGRKLNKTYTVPVFESPSEEDYQKELAEAGIPVTGKVKLIDGRTGEYFEHPVLVGETYILKLYHMAEDKMHARSTGPYSLITQQPLGGKAQFGGQRFGEMEVWALEAYGAANILQEMLTIKSDDFSGRTQAYRSILQGLDIPTPSIPESFKLLVRELNGLALGISPVGVVKAEPSETEAVSAESVDIEKEVKAQMQNLVAEEAK